MATILNLKTQVKKSDYNNGNKLSQETRNSNHTNKDSNFENKLYSLDISMLSSKKSKNSLYPMLKAILSISRNKSLEKKDLIKALKKGIKCFEGQLT